MLTIATPNYHVGRLRPVRVLVLHAAQVPCRPGRAEGVQRYLAGANVRASCHYATDPDNTVAGVSEPDTAWATPSVNADGIQIEQCGYAEFGSGARIPGRLGDRDGYEAARQAYGERAVWPSWDDHEPQRMIRTQLVPLAVDICRRNGLPATLLEPADLLAGRSGITDHHRCSIAYGGTHWDCGHHYPLAAVIDDIRRALAGTPTPTIPGDDDVILIIRNPAAGTLYWWDGQTKAPIAPAAGTFGTFDELRAGLQRLIDSHPNATTWEGGALYRDVPPHDLELIPTVG